MVERVISPVRSAIVTGGSAGIGLAIARGLARSGFALTLASRRAERLERAAEELRAGGHAVVAHALDVRDAQAVASLVDTHGERHGSLDVLVNNAGMGVEGPVEELSVGQIDVQLDVNLRAVVLAYRSAVPLLRRAAGARGSALVVNLASITAERPQPELAVYAATKAALIGLTRAMNLDLSGDGIRSCALCPGFVETEMTGYLRDTVPGSQMIPAEDIAGAVNWLLSISPRTLVPEIPFQRPGVGGEA